MQKVSGPNGHVFFSNRNEATASFSMLCLLYLISLSLPVMLFLFLRQNYLFFALVSLGLGLVMAVVEFFALLVADKKTRSLRLEFGAAKVVLFSEVPFISTFSRPMEIPLTKIKDVIVEGRLTAKTEPKFLILVLHDMPKQICLKRTYDAPELEVARMEIHSAANLG